MVPVQQLASLDDAEHLSNGSGDAQAFDNLYVDCLSTLESMIARDADDELSRKPSMQLMPIDLQCEEGEQGDESDASHTPRPSSPIADFSFTSISNLSHSSNTGNIFPTGYYPSSSLRREAPVRKRNARISLNSLKDFYVTHDLMSKSPKERFDYFGVV